MTQDGRPQCGGGMRVLRLALALLTRVPVGRLRGDAGDLRCATAAFPLVGGLLAAAGVAARAGAAPLGDTAATVVAVGAVIVLTGALHEDGLADTTDGLWGAADPQRRLAIMRDSAVGAYGVLALILVVALRVALLAPLPLDDFARAMLCAHVLARAAAALLAWRVPAAAATGLGAAIAGTPPAGAVVAVLVTVVAALVGAVGGWAPVPLLVACAGALLCARVFRRRLGGITGDTLGAATVVAELLVLAAVAALARLNLV